jgi:MAF protein
MENMTLILASQSPRRKELLNLTGWPFQIAPADIDESPFEKELPEPYVLRLARNKAKAAAQYTQNCTLVIAADTIVADGDTLLGKPADALQARKMLQSLKGRSHQVSTSVAVYSPANEQLLTEICTSQVPMRNYSNQEIEDYIASGDPMDKAGAYAIQNRDFHPVENFTGCFANVMGLPLCHLQRIMAQLGSIPVADLQMKCQNELKYQCQIYQDILKGKNLG